MEGGSTLISDRPLSGNVSKNRILQYIEFANINGYPLNIREIHPMDVAMWIAQLVKNEGYSIFNSERLKHTFYFLIKDSKYPMSIFIKRSHIKILLQKCEIINTSAFSYLFDLFLNASKQNATDPQSKELLNELPTELPINWKEGKSWFLTKTNESFKFNTVVCFYIWLTEEFRSICLDNNEDLVDALNDYLHFMKTNYARGKYKTMRRHIFFLLNQIQGIKERVRLLNNDTMRILKDFTDYKISGMKIHFKSQLISDTKWKPSNGISSQVCLENFLKKVIKVRGCSKTEIEQFSVFSLTIKDYLDVKQSYSIGRVESLILKQFIPYLLSIKNIPKKYRTQLINLYETMPKPPSSRAFSGYGNYLSRKDFVVMLNAAFTTCRSNNMLRFVIYLALVAFTALRLSEAAQVQLGDFTLDENGLLKDVGNGFGVLDLPAYKSKGGYSPAIKPYYIAVVPKLRELINSYLQMDFMKLHTPETYIMRHRPVSENDELYDHVPNHIKDEKAYSSWVMKANKNGVSIAREIFLRTALQLETKIHGEVSSHDFRKSNNDWIVKTPSNLPPDTVKRIGEIHLRHRKKGTVSELHYTSEPTLTEYITCINNALNFPWDLALLEIWERKRKIISSDNSPQSENMYPTLNTMDKEESIIDLVPEFKSELTISPIQKRIRALEIEIDELERLLKSGTATNKIGLQLRHSKLENELIIIKEV